MYTERSTVYPDVCALMNNNMLIYSYSCVGTYLNNVIHTRMRYLYFFPKNTTLIFFFYIGTLQISSCNQICFYLLKYNLSKNY